MEIDIAGKLFPNLFTLIAQLISTGILFLCFKKFLYGPLQKMLEKRAEYIEDNIKESKEINEQAKLKLQESDALARQSAKEYREIVDKAKEDALVESAKIIEEARMTAERKMIQANQQIEADKQKAKEEMQEQMVDIALSAATKIIQKEMDTKTNRDYVDAFVREVSH